MDDEVVRRKCCDRRGITPNGIFLTSSYKILFQLYCLWVKALEDLLDFTSASDPTVIEYTRLS